MEETKPNIYYVTDKKGHLVATINLEKEELLVTKGFGVVYGNEGGYWGELDNSSILASEFRKEKIRRKDD